MIQGGDYRIKIYAKDVIDESTSTDYNIENLPGLEFWLYTSSKIDADIKKYSKDSSVKDGYSGILVKDTSYIYHINFLGSVNVTMPQGNLYIDVMVAFQDNETTTWKCLATINTKLSLSKNPISKISKL